MSIVTIVTSPSLRRCVSYWFVLNLALTDTTIALTIVPLNTVWEFYGIWPLGTSACKFLTFADNSFSTISAYSIVLVSIDKYLYITHAIHYHYRMTKRLAVILILGVWICITTFSSVSIFAGILSSHYEEADGNSCIFVMKDSHAFAAAVISFFIPLALLCFTTLRIIHIAKRHLQRIRATPSFSYTDEVSRQSESDGTVSTKVTRFYQISKRKGISVFPYWNYSGTILKAASNITKQQTTTSTTDAINPQCEQNKQLVLNVSENTRQQEQIKTVSSCQSFQQRSSLSRGLGTRRPFCKLFGTVTIVITCFILMFAPYYITLMIDVSCHCVRPWLYEDVLVVLCRCHALVNPYIYISMDRKYKAAFRQMWKRIRRISGGKNVEHH